MQPQSYDRQRASSIPNGVFALLIINGLAFAAQQFLPYPLVRGVDQLTWYFGLWPPGAPQPLPQFMPWQLLTYGFLHDTHTVLHIGFNMFMLWMFGREVERVMGTRRFVTYYLVCIVGAGIVQLIVTNFSNAFAPTIGASGGVFGLLLAFGLMFPNRMIMLLFPPIPMPAKYMVVLFGLLELYLGVSGHAPGVAHFAHLGGMLFGFVLIRYWTRVRRR